MALAMTRPYQHPKTGVYWVRKVVPAPLRPIVGKRELVASLGTKDPADAKVKAAPVIQRFESIIAAARNGGSRLTPDDLEGICQQWYRAALAEWWEKPGQPSEWATYRDLLDDQIEHFDDPELETNFDVTRGVSLKPALVRPCRMTVRVGVNLGRSFLDADCRLRRGGCPRTRAPCH